VPDRPVRKPGASTEDLPFARGEPTRLDSWLHLGGRSSRTRLRQSNRVGVQALFVRVLLHERRGLVRMSSTASSSPSSVLARAPFACPRSVMRPGRSVIRWQSPGRDSQHRWMFRRSLRGHARRHVYRRRRHRSHLDHLARAVLGSALSLRRCSAIGAWSRVDGCDAKHRRGLESADNLGRRNRDQVADHIHRRGRGTRGSTR
jgi:hypothetical protein